VDHGQQGSVRLIALLAIVGVAVTLAAGCGSKSPSAHNLPATPAALRLQRSDLEFVVRGLRAVERPIRAELSATRAAWPTVADGFPKAVSKRDDVAISKASARANTLPTPSFLPRAGELTGPASGIAGLYLSFNALASRGWKLIDATASAAEHGPRAADRFLRANVALYIGSVYDAHFNLAAIGKNLRRAYTKLGASAAFGKALTRDTLDRVAAAYEPHSALLQPHPHAKFGR
jgi:hypothetical protein